MSTPAPAQADLPAVQDLAPAPMPPGRSAVVARMATRPQPIDAVLDDSVAQAPLPPERTAVVARQESPQQVATPTAPLPAPRPSVILTSVQLPSARPLAPAPPPIKPVVPVRASDDQSAALHFPARTGSVSAAAS
jgi:hypothetical protein